MKILLNACVIFVIFSSSLLAQTAPTLENLQVEINQLIHYAKYAVVTVFARSSHSYVINKNEGLFSFLKKNQEEKKENFWTVGSGIIYNQAGYIITRSTLLADFEEIKVSLCDGTEFEAEYIGTDQNTGLAVLKIDEKKLEPTRLGNSDETPLYSLVMVLGNSMGISPFASFGLINGITDDGKFILSNPIIPGNIGGAVFNLKGEIIAIVTAQIDADAAIANPLYLSAQKTGLAIPINQVARIVDPVIRFHQQQNNWLGIVIDSDSLAKKKLVVKDVFPGSPAARVGLRKGDRLIKYNETNLHNPKVLARLIEQTKPGTSVSINFIRQNRALKVFPRIEKMWPRGFNPNKPQHLTPKLMKESLNAAIQSPIIISPEKFQQINTRMIQMENEIRSLKNRLDK